MSLRIACDLDGTLADMDSALQAEAERLFGAGVDLPAGLRRRSEGPAGAESHDPMVTSPGVRPALTPASTWTRLSGREQRQLWAHVRRIENFWASLKEVEPGAVALLAQAAALQGWEVLFITTRPASAGETTQIQSQRWLQARGFDLPSVYVVSGSRGRIASALTLDVVLDDRPENCLDVATDSKAKPILVWRGAPESVPAGVMRLGIHVVYSIAEALQQLEAPGPPARRVLMRRLRAALGL